MGSDEGASWEKPVHRVEVSEFWIARRPVTNAQFRAFRPEHHSPVNDADDAPVRAVSWEDAMAYCRWLRGQTGSSFRLPTEAEWERAIRGGLEQKKYPWGDNPPVPESAVDNRDAWPKAPVNAFGLFIEHELWEWAADVYERNYYGQSPPRDPAGPPEGAFRVLRGGSYPNDPNSMRCSNRGSARPTTALPNVTFRIAQDVSVPTQITELRPPQAPPTDTSRGLSLPAAEPAPAATSSAPQGPRPAPPAAPPAPAPRAVANAGPVELTRVDATVSSVQVILALSLTGPAVYSTMELRSPDRLVIDLKNTSVDTARQYGSVDVGDLGVTRVRWAPFEAEVPTARVVVDLTQPVSHSVEPAASGLVIHLRPQ